MLWPLSSTTLAVITEFSATSANGELIARYSLVLVAVTLLPSPIANHFTPSKDPIKAPLLKPNQSR